MDSLGHRCHTRKEKIPKTESKMENGQLKMQTDKAIDDINQRLDRLTIALERQTKDKPVHESESSWVTCTGNPVADIHDGSSHGSEFADLSLPRL